MEVISSWQLTLSVSCLKEAVAAATEHIVNHRLHVCCLKSGMPLRSGQEPVVCAAVAPRERRSCSSGEVFIVTGAATRDLFS